MDNVIKAYITTGISAVLGVIYRIFILGATLTNNTTPGEMDLTNPTILVVFIIYSLLALTLLALTIIFLYRDAQQRNLSKAHALWALLGILGVFVYHIGFVRRNKPQDIKTRTKK